MRGALERPGLQVGNISSGSILVELHCYLEKSFLTFVKDFEKEKVKQRLEYEFHKVGFKEEVKVSFKNEREVYKKLDLLR